MTRGILYSAYLPNMLHIDSVHYLDIVSEVVHVVNAVIFAVAERRVSFCHVVGWCLYF